MILEVPTRLTPGSGWLHDGSNSTQLRLFLQAYGVQLDDCYEIRFAKRWMEVRRFESTKKHEADKNGMRYIGNDNEVAKREPAIFRYRSGLTPKVH